MGLLSTTSSSGNQDLTFSGYLKAREGILRKMFHGSQCCRTPSVIRSKLRIFTNGYRNKTNRALCAKMYTNSKRTCIAKANLEFTGKIINMKSNYL